MKKAKFLTLALVVAIMMVGAGYAYWSETLGAGINVSTGKLDIGIMEATIDDDGDPYVDVDVNYVEGEDWVVFTAEGLYPGKDVVLTCTVKNNGTIPAVLKGIKIKDLVLPVDEINPEHIKLDAIITDSEGTPVDLLEAFEVGVDEEYTLTIITGLDGDLVTGDLYEDQSLSFTMELKYGQHNDGSAFEFDIPDDFPFDLGL